ncbi:16S ribosomal RNA methyltransferase RsmE [Staphylococcus sp. AntiMn-1]|nr:16S ribosomal RNA methyltransferase RsmE [Staphylococcus sp. AntiMn-1]
MKSGDHVLVIFGPEGGLSEDEVALFDGKAYQIGLGPRILRAETAPLYVLSAVSFEKDLLD